MVGWLERLSDRVRGRPTPGPGSADPPLLAAYLRLGRRPGAAPALDPRLELLVSQLAAELSGCGWCIEAGRHRGRKAGLTVAELALVRAHPVHPAFSDRERAALGFGRAVAEAAAGDALLAPPVAAEARRHFSEREIVRLTILAAGEHFGDCLAEAEPGAGVSYPITIRGWT